MSWANLIGLKIVAFRGDPLSYVLFDDEKTVMHFREQDPYDYHDCASHARVIEVSADAGLWRRLFECEEGVRETKGLDWPFL